MVLDDVLSRTAFMDQGLVNLRQYWYLAYPQDEVPNFGEPRLGSGVAHSGSGETVMPVTEFQVIDPGLGNRLDLSWVNSETETAAFVRIFRFVGTCIESPDPAQYDRKVDVPSVAPSQPQTWTDDQVEDNLEYCYAVFAGSGILFSPAATDMATSTDATPPAPVTDFTPTTDAVPGDHAMDLSWTDPQDADLAGVRILRREGMYPENPMDIEAVLVCDVSEQGCRDVEVAEGVEYLYRAWTYDEVPNYSVPADAAATFPYVDDDGDGHDEYQGDCDDNNFELNLLDTDGDGSSTCDGDCDDADPLYYPGAPPSDCSDTDWACDGQVWVDAWCVDNAPVWLEPQCATGSPTCDAGYGCEWYEAQDHTTCAVTTDPDYSYDICVEGGCNSPGACGDATCNSPGPHFSLPLATGHTDFSRTGDPEPVVTDNVTGMMWQGCAAGLSGSDCATGSAGTYVWQGALAYCDDLSWAGYTDWRLPDSHELQSIVDFGSSSPAIDQNAFPQTPSSFFWSSSSWALAPSNACYVNFANGLVPGDLKVYAYYVRCVRSGP